MARLTSNQQAAQKRIAQKRKIEQKKAFRRALLLKKFSELTQTRPAIQTVVDDTDEASGAILEVREYKQYLDNIIRRKFEPIMVAQS